VVVLIAEFYCTWKRITQEPEVDPYECLLGANMIGQKKKNVI